MKVFIKTVNNEQHEIEYDPEVVVLVNHFKELVQQKTAVEIDRQRLIYRGKVLQDNSDLQIYKLEDQSVIHLVVRPVNFRELQQQAASSSSTTSAAPELTSAASWQSLRIPAGLSTIGAPGITRVDQRTASSSGSLFGNNNMNSITPTNTNVPVINPSSNGSAAVTPENSEALPNIEHIRQSLLTLNTLLSTMNPTTTEFMPRQIDENQAGFRRFYTGQWLDVKDTVNQWLEATILQVDQEGNRIFVHYNGWPARWDEWISTNSPRIAPFRSRTNHSALNVNLSPNPNIIVNHAPSTGPNDIRAIIPEFARVVSIMNNMMQEISEASIESLQRVPLREAPTTSADDLPWDQIVREGRSSLEPTVSAEGTAGDEQLKALYRDACPLLDRMGRALADLSTQMWNYVEPGSARHHNSNRPIDPLGSIESRIISLLRERPPSPPPSRAYRAPITAAAQRNEGQDLFRSPASLLSFLAANQALNRTAGDDRQVDIQIAILPGSALLPGSGTLAQGGSNAAVANITSTLQSQVQQLAQRTQELTERTNAVTQLSSALRTSIQARIAEQSQAISDNDTRIDATNSNTNQQQSGDDPESQQSNDFSIEGSIPSDILLSEQSPNQSIDSDGSNLADLEVRNFPQGSQTLIPADTENETQTPYFNSANSRLESYQESEAQDPMSHSDHHTEQEDPSIAGEINSDVTQSQQEGESSPRSSIFSRFRRSFSLRR